MYIKVIIMLGPAVPPMCISAQCMPSYIQKEIIGQSVQGPISEVPQHSGTWVEWFAVGDAITMMDGSQWKQTKSLDGNIHYRNTGTSGQNQSYIQLLETIFNKDYSKMNIRYVFGPIGMGIQRVGKYYYIGDVNNSLKIG